MTALASGFALIDLGAKQVEMPGDKTQAEFFLSRTLQSLKTSFLQVH